MMIILFRASGMGTGSMYILQITQIMHFET